MRVLYICGEEIPGTGGGAVHAFEVATGLARLGHKVDLIAARGSDQSAREIIAGVKIRRLRMRWRSRTVPLLAARKLFSLVRRKYDIVMERHVTAGGLGFMVSVLKNIPLVLEVNSPHVEEYIWRRSVRSPVRRWALRTWARTQFTRADLVLAPTLSIVPEDARRKTTLVEWAVNTEKFHRGVRASATCRKLAWQYGLTDHPVVLFTGTFRRWHGVGDLPEIIDRVVHRVADARFLLVGDGEMRRRVETAVKTRGLDEHVVSVGPQPYHRMPYYVALADVGIAPYDASAYPPLERFGFFWSPLKIFEYMATGLPTVTFAYDYLDKLIGDECGIVVAPRRIGQMVDAIAKLLDDGKLARALGETAARRATERYSWQQHVEVLEGLLESLVRGRSDVRFF